MNKRKEFSITWEDLNEHMIIAARVFCKNELWFYVVALSNGISGLV